MSYKHRMVPLVAVLLAWGCNGAGGGAGAPANASVTGRLAGQDFDFTPAGATATLDASGGTLTVQLCEGGCSSGEGRAVLVVVHGAVAELRAGGSFAIGDRASATARAAGAGAAAASSASTDPMPASAGEVVLDSADLRDGGRTVGTFQLEFGPGSILGGFFDLPVAAASGGGG